MGVGVGAGVGIAVGKGRETFTSGRGAGVLVSLFVKGIWVGSGVGVLARLVGRMSAGTGPMVGVGSTLVVPIGISGTGVCVMIQAVGLGV